MTVKVRIEPEARDELRAAKRWYDERGLGLGAEFVRAVKATMARIRRVPRSCPSFAGSPDLHRALVERFPYMIVYLVHEGVMRVLAIAHQARKPSYLKKTVGTRRRQQ